MDGGRLFRGRRYCATVVVIVIFIILVTGRESEQEANSAKSKKCFHKLIGCNPSSFVGPRPRLSRLKSEVYSAFSSSGSVS